MWKNSPAKGNERVDKIFKPKKLCKKKFSKPVRENVL